MTILQDMSQEAMLAEIERLRATNARLSKAVASKLKLKVSEKGAASLYGMGRWPVTLYKSQWQTLLANVEMIQDWLRENEHLLADKDETAQAA